MTQPIQEPTEPGFYFATRGLYRTVVQVFLSPILKRLMIASIACDDYEELSAYIDYAPAIDPLTEPQQ